LPPTISGVRHTFAADLLRAAAFAHGVDELDASVSMTPSTVGTAQKACVQSLMRLQEAKEPGALGKAGEQGAIVSASASDRTRVADASAHGEAPKVTISLGQRWASGCL